jgi:hypothetical protein
MIVLAVFERLTLTRWLRLSSAPVEGFPRTAVLCREEKIILTFFEEGSRQLKLV